MKAKEINMVCPKCHSSSSVTYEIINTQFETSVCRRCANMWTVWACDNKVVCVDKIER